jgi:hypothetical protein
LHRFAQLFHGTAVALRLGMRIKRFVPCFRVARRLAPLFWCGVLLLSGAAPASAQLVIDPQFVEFNASPDHSATASDGTQVVSRYDLEFYTTGQTSPVQVVNIGKPAPDAGGKIHVGFLPTTPTPGVQYEAKVLAVGPTGSGESTSSNPFTFTGSCNYVLSQSTFSFGTGGGSGALDVLAGSTCTWTGVSSASWLTVSTSATTGPGRLSFSVLPNTSTSQRSATVTVEGQTVSITQLATQLTCTPSLSTTSISSVAGGASGQIGVTLASGCSWSAGSAGLWLGIG